MEDAVMSEKNLKFNPRHANGKNPNNKSFWQDLGYEKRPRNWKALLKEMGWESKRQKEYVDPSGGYDWPMCKDDY